MEKKQGVIIALLAVCVFFSVIIAAMYLTSDRTAPVITVDESKVKPYSAEQGEEVLKSYAKAVDAKDGDVSSSIVIENIYVMPDMTRAKVIFAARDHNNNVSKYSYMIAYEASEEEIEAKDKLTHAETTTAAETERQTVQRMLQRRQKRKRQLQRAKQKQLQADQSLFYRQQKRRLKRETALM